jgi:hypothetical protein
MAKDKPAPAKKPAVPAGDLQRLRILSAIIVKDIQLLANHVIETDEATAKSLIAAGAADDDADAVAYALENEAAEIITV